MVQGVPLFVPSDSSSRGRAPNKYSKMLVREPVLKLQNGFSKFGSFSMFPLVKALIQGFCQFNSLSLEGGKSNKAAVRQRKSAREAPLAGRPLAGAVLGLSEAKGPSLLQASFSKR